MRKIQFVCPGCNSKQKVPENTREVQCAKCHTLVTITKPVVPGERVPLEEVSGEHDPDIDYMFPMS